MIIINLQGKEENIIQGIRLHIGKTIPCKVFHRAEELATMSLEVKLEPRA